MTHLENIYNATVTFTDKQIENVIYCWEIENDKALETFNSLVRLGDSKQVAFASVMVEKETGDNSEFYINAYTK